MPVSLDLTHRNASATNADAHAEALIDPCGCEAAVLGLLNAVADYARCYRNRHGTGAGLSYLNGHKGMRPILLGLISIALGGEVGRLDRETLRGAVKGLAERHGVSLASI